MTKLLYEIKDGIGWIRFNRPEVLNAFDPEKEGGLSMSITKLWASL